MVTSQLLRLRRPDGQALGGVMIWFMFRQQRKTGPNEQNRRQRRRETNRHKTRGELRADEGQSLSGQQPKGCRWIQVDDRPERQRGAEKCLQTQLKQKLEQ